MKEYIIGSNEAGQRFDKYLSKLLSEASMGFIFKMLRKKNFTLNNKKADGKEILKQGDCIKIFLADETFNKFNKKNVTLQNQYVKYSLDDLNKKSLAIIYEDDDILIFNKPAGMLSQKSAPGDISVNEYLIGYMLSSNQISESDLNTFKPSISNRLDRNTSGAILCGKTLAGLQFLAQILKERTLHKYYKTIVYGKINQNIAIDGYINKDEKTNTVTIKKTKDDINDSYIKTEIVPLKQFIYQNSIYTEVEVLLVTGKTHQIRAHLSSIGHPIIGDYKYGNIKKNANIFPLKYQLLHAYKMQFPSESEIYKEKFYYLAKKEIIAELSNDYSKILRILTNGDME